MNTNYREGAQALVDAGYVSDADLEAAAAILADALIVVTAEEIEAEAMDDYSEQEDVVAETEVWAAEDAAAGDAASVAIDEDIIDAAVEQALDDRDAVAAAAAVEDAAYTDAAASLLAAALIDEADAEAVATLLANLWIEENSDEVAA